LLAAKEFRLSDAEAMQSACAEPIYDLSSAGPVDGTPSFREEDMRKIVALMALGAVFAFPAGAALAQQGTSSSYGTEGWGPRIPTIALTPKERAWNHDHQAQYRAEDGSEWLREHAQAGQRPWFP
jgi:hypothetical protein